MTNRGKMLVSIAIDAAKNCIHVFEAEYPAGESAPEGVEANREMAQRTDPRQVDYVAGTPAPPDLCDGRHLV
jgi:hypothetical protein